MRELEFLPSWYPQARRRVRWLRLQATVTVLLIGGMALWMMLAGRNVKGAQAALAVVDHQLKQSELELSQLQVQLNLKTQLEVQRKIVSQLGLPVEASRLISTLNTLMPKEMSLVELALETEERQRAANGNSTAVKKANDVDKQIDRSLKVKLLAVAPSDVDLANFLAGLTSTPFFQNVSPGFSRDKSESGHLMREFEVTFTMSLNTLPPGN